MDAGYLRKVLPHPLLQYIPIPFTSIIERDSQAMFPQPCDMGLSVIATQQDWDRTRGFYQIPAVFPGNFKSDLAVLCTNCHLEMIMYRGYMVYLLGKRKPRGYHLVYFSKKYFYKTKLFFGFYDETGQKKAYQNIDLK